MLLSGTNQSTVKVTLRNPLDHADLLEYYIVPDEHQLAQDWIVALKDLLQSKCLLEKNFCFLGFPDSPRNGPLLIKLINESINAVNSANLGYHIDNYYTMENSVDEKGGVNHAQFNLLHRYFEDLQGVSGRLSEYYARADARTRWHIRQLNLLCHEYESLKLSMRKAQTAPEWQRPSQLMCWLSAPRFTLTEEDYELFGIDTINRSMGGVYVGVNKAVGKHHWEVFNDEGRDSRVGELTTRALAGQMVACGDFDIEWSTNPRDFAWQQENLAAFRAWLTANGFDPEDKQLTIGHPKVAQVDLKRTFGSQDTASIWHTLNTHLNVVSISTSTASAKYDYNWTDPDYMEQQIAVLQQGN